MSKIPFTMTHLTILGVCFLFLIGWTTEMRAQSVSEKVVFSGIEKTHAGLTFYYSLNGDSDSLTVPLQVVQSVLNSNSILTENEPNEQVSDSTKEINFEYTSILSSHKYFIRSELNRLTVFTNDSTGEIVELPSDIVSKTGAIYRSILDPEERNTSVLGIDSGRFVFDIQHSYPLILAFLVIVFCVVAAVFLIVRHFQRARAQLVESRRILFEVREQERAAIASDLHDGPIQSMQLIQTASEEDHHKTIEIAASAANQLRELCSELKPPILHHFGFIQAAKAYVSEMLAKVQGIEIKADFEVEPVEISSENELLLYKVLIESLSNAIKHSRATLISVSFQVSPGRIKLAIVDNGVGFKLPNNLGEFERNGHLGLSFLYQRAESNRAQFAISSRLGRGTKANLLIDTSSKKKWLGYFRKST